MELVTLAQVTLHRAGSASGRATVRQNDISGTHEVMDAEIKTLRELILSIAELHGDPRDCLKTMTQRSSYDRTQRPVIIFDVQTRHMQYGNSYATCFAFPALKVGSRYFQLNEVDGPNG